MNARIAGVVLPAKVLKQGSLEELDLQSIVGRSGEIAKEHEVTSNAAMRSTTLAGGSGHRCGCHARLEVPHRLALYIIPVNGAGWPSASYSTVVDSLRQHRQYRPGD